MKFAILLTKEDIITTQIGNHFEINTGDVIINFTPDAAQELVNDFKLFEITSMPKGQLSIEQLEAVIQWMNEWEQLKDTAIPIRFLEDFKPNNTF